MTTKNTEKAVTVHERGGVTIVGEGIAMLRLLTIARGIKLEGIGLKLTRGVSCLAIAKREFGFKGSRAKVYEQVLEMIREHQKKAEIAPEELDALISASSPI